uniref:O-acyltransferase WSD1 C-terminal domain-containing protein n=1 Tax=Strombidium inclinatum TaxID=197538 RepID=A0A7S3N3G8_9SPIT|mmetsp:Transcript_6615/g.10636  ORF Transcript_6615/g.10636 Transcript_6615/m.10636 type:complete len:123 (+) Transcript_6615:1174-1542(+)
MDKGWLTHNSALALLKLVLKVLPPWIVRWLIDDNCCRCTALFVFLKIDDEQKYLGRKVEAHDFYSLLPGDCCFSFMALLNHNALGVGLIVDTARISKPQVFLDIFLKKYESLMNSEVRKQTN